MTITQVPKEVRVKAAETLDILREYGWCQGELIDPEGHLCLLGAIFMAYYGRPHSAGFSHEALVRTIQSSLGPIPGVGFWNDQPSRTQAEVEALLTKIATYFPGVDQ